MKILLADRLPDATTAALEALGFQLDARSHLTAEDLPGAIRGVHVLVVRSTRVTEATIEAADHLHLVIRAGAGTNTIAVEAAARAAVYVANCPGKNAVAVAELTMGLVLALDRAIPDNVSSLRAGQWEKGRFSGGRGLMGRRMGIVGYGRIGQEVASRARAFGMEVSSFSEDLDPDRARELGVDYCGTVLELAATCDVISVHVPLMDETRHLIDREVFAAMKPGTLFVHAARGGVVDDEAMREAVASGHIRAASDVFEVEPKGSKGAYEGAFQDLDGFYGTHHIGASTVQAQEAIGDEILRIVENWQATGEVLNCVNRSDQGPAKGQLLVRHLDRVGVLATVLDVLKEAQISVKGMRNAIFDGTGTAVASMSLDLAPGEETLDAISERCADVLSLVWTPR